MAQLLKQYGASDTASEHRIFLFARLKLTGVYVGIVALILLGFSTFLIQSIGRNLNDADEGDFAGPDSHQHFVENTLGTVENEILLVDLIILVVSAGVSYVLAGYTLQPIQNALGAQKKFSENASHELRTPLAVMKNDIEVLMRNPAPTKETIQSTLRSSVEEIDRLSVMVRDLLTLARSGTNSTPLVEDIDLELLLEKIAEKMRSAAVAKGVSLDLYLAEPLRIEGHISNLERIFINLIQNAIDHTPKGGSISVRLEKEITNAIVSISDTGSGISAQDLPRIFERFYKGESSTGTGLGLAIVKDLAEQQRGEVSIESTLGKGTTARLRFPLA